MSKSTFIRISGWALLLGGIAFSLLFLNWFMDENYPLLHWDKQYGTISYIAGLLVAPVLTAIGVFGLRARYGKAIGSSGKAVLLVGTILGVGMNIVGAFGDLLNLFGGYSDFLWGMALVGAALVMFCLALFGFFALSSKPLPRWNSLPILAGIGFPVLLVVSYILNWANSFTTLVAVVLLVQMVAMVVLGFILQGDAQPQEMAMAAA